MTTPCEAAKIRLEQASERLSHEREVLSGYREKMSSLEDDHQDLTRRFEDASSLVVENERQWESARETLRNAIDADKEAETKYKYWQDQNTKLRNGEQTVHSGEPNEKALVEADLDRARDVDVAASKARTSAENSVKEAKKRHDRSKTFLQEKADAKTANEDARSTLRNKIEVQEEAVSAAEESKRNAEAAVNEHC